MVFLSALDLIRISHLHLITNRRLDIQFFQNRIGSRSIEFLSDFAVFIIQIAKRDRLGRTRLLTSRFEFVGLERTILQLRLALMEPNAMDTERAFFHYPPMTNGHFRVQS